MTTKRRSSRKKNVVLKGNIHSGILFIGDCQFFADSPQLEFDPTTGKTIDVTPNDPLNPFNTLDKTLELVKEGEVNLEILPHVPGRGVLINTHLTNGNFVVKKKVRNGKIVGYTIDIQE